MQLKKILKSASYLFGILTLALFSALHLTRDSHKSLLGDEWTSGNFLSPDIANADFVSGGGGSDTQDCACGSCTGDAGSGDGSGGCY